MNVREILRYELWDRETSLKALRPVGIFLKHAGIVLGVLVVVVGIFAGVELHWLTSGERSAGRAALAKIEAPEQLEKDASDGFDAMDGQAKASVTLAQQTAWTLRDRRTSKELEFYRNELETVHRDKIRELQVQSFVIQRHLELHANPEFDQKSQDLNSQIFNAISSLLHKELD
jgi:hypothetical protein